MSLLATGLALGSALFGAYKSAKAAKKQENEAKDQQAKENAWYRKEYYKNYLDSEEARAAMKRVEDTLNKQNQQAQATATITGATPESVIARQESDNKLLDNVATGIAANATARKNQVSDQHQANQIGLSQQRMAQHSIDEIGGAQLMNNGLGILGTAMEASSKMENNDKPSASGINPNGTGTIRIGADGKMYQE